MIHRPFIVGSALALALSFVASSAAQPAPALRTKNIIPSGLNLPTYVTHAPGDKCRLFVTEKRGAIKVIDIKSEPPTVIGTFLDIDALVLGSTSVNGEQGLLSLTFHPDYWNNGYFFVNYTANGGATVVARYKVSDDNPNVADPNSGLTLLTIPQPFSNHNGGWIDFGPDGYLYIAMGDGGSAGDPNDRAQNPNDRLGKILRIDPNVEGDIPPYFIPSDNPFAAGGGDPTVYHLGVRNPYRCSFDRATGGLYIADVGQNLREEISYAPPGVPGMNFGWRCKEGFNCFQTSAHCTCATGTLVNPFRDYPHGGGPSAGNCIIGGYVYRGPAIPDLQGFYFHSDFSSSNTWVLRYDPMSGTVSNLTNINAQITPSTGGTVVNSLCSYGEDAQGEMYIVKHSSQTTGGVFKIIPATGEVTFHPADLNYDGRVDGSDLAILLGAWGTIGGDTNCDFTTDGSDLAVLLGGWAP